MCLRQLGAVPSILTIALRALARAGLPCSTPDLGGGTFCPPIEVITWGHSEVSTKSLNGFCSARTLSGIASSTACQTIEPTTCSLSTGELIETISDPNSQAMSRTDRPLATEPPDR